MTRFFTTKCALAGASMLAMGFAFTQSASANITYFVNESFPGGGSVTGSITTNGMLGTIPNFGLPPNQFFQSYTLTLTGGGQSTTIMGSTAIPNSGPFGQNLGLALSATPTDLIWNFNGSNSNLSFQSSLFGPPCFFLRGTAPGGCSGGPAGSTNAMNLAFSTTNIFTKPQSGSVVFAAVPEPSTWAMMLLGFAGLGFAGYCRTRKGQAVT